MPESTDAASSPSSSEGAEGLRRALGPLDATCVVIGAIVGVGIFFTPSKVARIAGSGELALIAWGVGGLIAMLGALCFAELGSMYRQSGAQYQILRDSYGRLPSFLFVFCNATAIQAGAIAIIALICVQNIGYCIWDEGLQDPLDQLGLAAVLIVALGAANALGVRWGSAIQNVTVFAKVGTLIAIFALAALWGEESVAGAVAEEPPEGSQITLLFAALTQCLFAFGGWQHALWVGGEVRDPARNVPRAVIVGVLVVVVTYLLANWAYLRLLGPRGVAESGVLAADAVATAWPAWGGRAVAAAVAFSAFGVLNAQLLSGPRLIYAMAQARQFFQPFAQLSGRWRTPVAAIILLAALSIALLLVGHFGTPRSGAFDTVDYLLTGVVFIDGTFFVLTGAALFVLRRRFPGRARAVRVPGYPVVPLLFVLGEACVVLGAYAEPTLREAAVFGLGWIGVAAVVYFLFFHRRQANEEPGRAGDECATRLRRPLR